LKAILHHGEAVFTTLGPFTKIAGPEVILAHRLLKNSIADEEYLMMTPAFYELVDYLTPSHAFWQSEYCEGFGDVPVLVC
jgi:hypothetical protein